MLQFILTILQLAKQYHPDSNKQDPAAARKFAEISNAYDVLKDEKKRRLYDQVGADGMDGAQAGGGRGPHVWTSDNFEHFKEMFRRAGFDFSTNGDPFGFAEENVGEDLAVPLRVSFMEAAKGTKKDVTYNTLVHCKTCSGSGAEPGTKKNACPSCRGTGYSSSYVIVILYDHTDEQIVVFC